MLFQPPDPLNQRELEILSELDELKQEVASRIAPRRWFGSLRRLTTARAIRSSIGIEGYMVSLEDAVAALEDEEPLDAKDRDRAALLGYREALTLILQKADDDHFGYSTEFLNALHYMMIGYDMSAKPGLWRRRHVMVVDSKNQEIVYEAPSSDRVPELMQELVGTLNDAHSETHPVVRAAMAHLNFVMIHPHADGNGRMARALQTLVLTRDWETRHPMFTSIEQYLGGSRTSDYYDVLAITGGTRWRPKAETRETRTWIDFCLTAHYRQAKYLRQTARYFEELYNLFEQEITAASLPDRTLAPVVEAALGLRIANGPYRKAAGIGTGTASRDLKALVEAGLLEGKGAKRGSHYVASERTVQMARKINPPQPVADPFDRLEVDRDDGQRTLFT